jgi:iron complex outermembrane receptor protein
MTRQRVLRTGASIAIIAAVAGVDITAAYAQSQIDEIIVTTRKRAENIQDIPLVITAFTGETLERKGLDSIEDIVRLTPGLQFDNGTFPQDIRIVIRGLSPTRGRPNVALLLDGVDVSSESVSSGGGSLLINPRLFDMERVEIVKGPQSALYGRSAFAGAINYVTKKPTDEWEGSAQVEVGQRNSYEGKVGIYGPLVEDKVRVGLNVAGWRFDGFYDNAVTGADLGNSDGVGVAGSAIFTLSDNVKLTTRAEYTDDHLGQTPIANVGSNMLAPIPAAALGTVISPAVRTISQYAGSPPDADGLIVTISEDPVTGKEFRGSDRKIFRVSGQLDWEMDWGTVTSVTHYADAAIKQEVENTRQGSFSRLTSGTTFRTDDDTELFSQELRLQSGDEQRLRWMVGGLYWEESVHQNNTGIACTNNQILPVLPFIPCGPLFALNASQPPSVWRRDTEHWSAFGMFEFDVSEQVSLHAEARYTSEDLFVSGPGSVRLIDAVGLNGPVTTVPAVPPTRSGTDKDHFIAPRFSAEYKPNDDALLYASVAMGAKPSGLSTASAAASGFDPDLASFEREEMWVYEIGAKTTWLDGRFVANVTGYYEDFSDKQTTSQVLLSNGLLGTRIVNASAAEVKGLEFDFAWAPVDGLNLNAGYTYIDATYKDFVTNTGGPAPIAAAGNCRPVTIAGRMVCEIDQSGKRLEDSAKHALTLGGSYTAPISADINWLVETDVSYQGSRFDTSENILKMQSYWLANLRLGLTSESWEVVAFANNVFNDDTIKTAFNATDFSKISLGFAPPFTFVLPNGLQVVLPDKRQVGVRAKYRF